MIEFVQRWFLTTPEQYDSAPVGTEVWDDGGCPCGCVWIKTAEGHWQNSKHNIIWGPVANFRREVRKWGSVLT